MSIEFDPNAYSDAELQELQSLGGRVGLRAQEERIDRLDEEIAEEIAEEQRRKERELRRKKERRETERKQAEEQAARYFRNLSDTELKLLAQNPKRGPESSRATELYLEIPGVTKEWSDFSQRDAARHADKVLEERQREREREQQEQIEASAPEQQEREALGVLVVIVVLVLALFGGGGEGR